MKRSVADSLRPEKAYWVDGEHYPPWDTGGAGMFCSGLRACQVHALEQGPRLSSLIDSPISPLPRAWLIEMESERGVRKDRGAFSATHLLPKSVQTDCEVTAEGHHGGVTVSEPWCPHEALLSFPSGRVQPTATHLSPWPHDLGYGHGGHLCTRLSLPTRPTNGDRVLERALGSADTRVPIRRCPGLPSALPTGCCPW